MNETSGIADKRRAEEREAFLRKLQQKVVTKAHTSGDRLDFFRAVLHITMSYLAAEQKAFSLEAARIPWKTSLPALEFFAEMLTEIRDFRRSYEEGKDVMAGLLEWLAIQVAAPHHQMLQEKESGQPLATALPSA